MRVRLRQHQRQSIVAWGTLRKLLSKYTAVVLVVARFRPQRLRQAAPARGRAEHADPVQHVAEPQGMILYAVTRGCPIGVDVEETRRRAGGMEPVRRFFAQAEVAALQALPTHVQHDAFFRFWTLKEAYIKARGLGLSIPLQSFAFSLGNDRPPTVAFTKPDAGSPNAWQFAELRFGDRHRAAVALQCPQDTPMSLRVVAPRRRECPLKGRNEAQGPCRCPSFMPFAAQETACSGCRRTSRTFRLTQSVSSVKRAVHI